MSGPLAVLGATSQIARDFMVTAHRDHGTTFALYARRPDAARAFLQAQGLPSDWRVGSLADAHSDARNLGEAAGVLNFVGVGDPAKAKAMGAAIFDATIDSDRLARAFLEARPGLPYLFCSSGAVYGEVFETPAAGDTPSVIPVNQLQPQHWYTVAKLHAEAVHRSMAGATVLDLRIFNYFSRTHDPAARFLVTDMVRCVAEDRVFETTDAPMARDYIHPSDLTALILLLLAAPPGTNQPVDAYSREPITKAELVALFREEFGLRAEIRPQADAVNATGAKPHYYSQNRAAEALGYRPRFSSAEAIRGEARAMLERMRER